MVPKSVPTQPASTGGNLFGELSGSSDDDSDGEQKKKDKEEKRPMLSDSDAESRGSLNDLQGIVMANPDEIADENVEEEEEELVHDVEAQSGRVQLEYSEDAPYFVRMPNFLSVATHPFDQEHYEEDEDDDQVKLDDEGRNRLKLRALNSVSDNIHEIYTYYVQFEREEGSLAELDLCLDRVNSQVSHRAVRPQKKQQPERKEVEKKETKRSAGGEPIVKKVKDNDGGFKAPLPPSASPNRKISPSGVATSSSSTRTTPAPPAVLAASGTEDARTVFVSNLEFTTTEDDIKAVLEGVVEVRLARKAHTDQSHRGFAYVVLATEELARRALGNDRVMVKGRPMFISINDPQKRVGFKYAAALEKSKVFVRNVHFQATDDELVELFSQFGSISSVRRVTHRDGKPKGVAYVDFKTEEDAQKCVTTPEKLMLRERELAVALSDPPRKEARGKSAPEPPVENGPRKGHAGMLRLLPRAVATRPAPAPQNTARPPDAMDTSDGQPSAPKPLSNDQFRQLLLKK
uniref:RRM domain-containing protein n=1 Tax=Caenorhabditis japonica TaxID=281687 RepID=A0A8R1I4Z5_CAEJA